MLNLASSGKMKIEQQIKVAVDSIVFGYANSKLYVLLIKQKYGELKNIWALPGGFVKSSEKLIDAVYRELEEETGIKINYLEQLYTFGDDIERDPRFRVISVSYFALVNASNVNPVAGSDADKSQWFEFNKLPTLAFDHKLIIKTAHERLKAKLMYEPIGFELLPKTFLFAELENLYAAVLNETIDRRNFRKKFLSLKILDETSEYAPQKTGRPGKLFKFNKTQYKLLLKKGFQFELKF